MAERANIEALIQVLSKADVITVVMGGHRIGLGRDVIEMITEGLRLVVVREEQSDEQG